VRLRLPKCRQWQPSLHGAFSKLLRGKSNAWTLDDPSSLMRTAGPLRARELQWHRHVTVSRDTTSSPPTASKIVWQASARAPNSTSRPSTRCDGASVERTAISAAYGRVHWKCFSSDNIVTSAHGLLSGKGCLQRNVGSELCCIAIPRASYLPNCLAKYESISAHSISRPMQHPIE
jgi:hypothetical protein